MSSRIAVLYDAYVLYPAPLRDLLMHLALTDLFRAHWTEAIHEEWTRNLLEKRPDLRPQDLQRTRALMDEHVRDSLITGNEHLIPAVELPDPDDRHVVAAAIYCGASLIVTFNLKDYPPELLEHVTWPHGTRTTSFSGCSASTGRQSAWPPRSTESH